MAELQPPQQPKPHPSLFHRKTPAQPDLKRFSADINNLSRRMRILEESFTNMRRVLQVTEQNMLEKHRTFATEIRTVISDIGDVKQEINDIREKIIELVREMEEAATRDEVKILEKYINFWNPVKFVTQNEVEALVKEIIKKQKDVKKE